MINPPIEGLFEKANSRYALVVAISKRAKELLVEKTEFFKDNQKIKPIEYASKEFAEDLFAIKRSRID